MVQRDPNVIRLPSRQVTQHLPLKAAFVVLATFVPATILFVRQTDDALLGVDTYWGALLSVWFWAAPVLLVYLLGVRYLATVLVLGVGIVSALSWQWWYSATDWHSTASFAPALVAWIYIPIGMVGWSVLARFARLWAVARERDHAGDLP